MVNFFINKKNFFIFFVLLPLVILFFLLLTKKPNLENKNPMIKNKTSPTITPISIKKHSSPSIFIPKKTVPTFSGVYEEEIPQEKFILSQKINDLQTKLPLTTQFFEIKFDYNQNKFIVFLKPPFEENREKFFQWLIDNNYGEIPKDYFDLR